MRSETAPVTLASIQAPVHGGLEAVQRELRRMIQSDFGLITEVNSHLLHMQGKMFRPTLVLLASEATTPAEEARVASLAAVIELVHPGGIVVRVPAGTDTAALRTVLGVLDERSGVSVDRPAEARSC